MADSLGITEKVRAVAQMGSSELVSEWQAQFGSPPTRAARTYCGKSSSIVRFSPQGRLRKYVTAPI
jgi:hypothetical protein